MCATSRLKIWRSLAKPFPPGLGNLGLPALVQSAVLRQLVLAFPSSAPAMFSAVFCSTVGVSARVRYWTMLHVSFYGYGHAGVAFFVHA